MPLSFCVMERAKKRNTFFLVCLKLRKLSLPQINDCVLQFSRICCSGVGGRSMKSIHSGMDCNMRSPLQWDWDNLFMSDPENHKKHLSTDLEVETGEGIESIVPYFSSLTGDSTTNFWYTAVSKTSKSASQSPPGDSTSNTDFVQVKSCTALEVSVASAESELCLKLGKRTYSEEMSAVSVKLLTPSIVAPKKSKSCSQSTQVPRCQIDGCELDLSSAKDYHRKHRVCENHSKCPKVTVGGLERRFCQQCSRLHAISEFDEKKRSCRKRLSHHNARRRKPQGIYPLNPERVYDRRQHTNMLWKGLSLNKRSGEKYTWGTTFETKPRQTENSFTLSFQRGNACEEQFFAGSSRSLFGFHNSDDLLAGNTNFQLSGKGVGEYSGVLHESQDFHRALSLLSTSADPLVQPPVEPLSSLFQFDGVPK